VEQIDVLRLAIDVLEKLGVRYMVVGSYASGSYGEPRMTQDIDIVVELEPAHVGPLCDAFPSPDFYASKEAAQEAIRHRSMFNILHADTGTKIDFILPKPDEYGRTQIARRQRVQLTPGQSAFAARPEDVILGKLVFYQEGASDKHLRDIAGMLRISGTEIDQAYIEDWSRRLGLLPVWQATLEKARQDQ
jgi:hypothetical protein